MEYDKVVFVPEHNQTVRVTAYLKEEVVKEIVIWNSQAKLFLQLALQQG